MSRDSPAASASAALGALFNTQISLCLFVSLQGQHVNIKCSVSTPTPYANRH